MEQGTPPADAPTDLRVGNAHWSFSSLSSHENLVVDRVSKIYETRLPLLTLLTLYSPEMHPMRAHSVRRSCTPDLCVQAAYCFRSAREHEWWRSESHEPFQGLVLEFLGCYVRKVKMEDYFKKSTYESWIYNPFIVDLDSMSHDHPYKESLIEISNSSKDSSTLPLSKTDAVLFSGLQRMRSTQRYRNTLCTELSSSPPLTSANRRSLL